VDKRKRSHDLEAFKAAFARHRAITTTAAKSALALGYDVDDVVDIVQTIEPRHFVKSTTSKSNHKQWQDVYHIPQGGLVLHLKFTDQIVTEFVLLSFKEK